MYNLFTVLRWKTAAERADGQHEATRAGSTASVSVRGELVFLAKQCDAIVSTTGGNAFTMTVTGG